ncbi:UDP-N-acetylglucosamine 2-epimerase (hydrolyzing) [Clostridium botulinum]|uniref:UDP-N-acetylglucosamine 2-epimerase (Hydrolyzing) n=1 Tax=Clostridium botulinum TaxID=1491 RepID=A0A846K123_CLOBO|nr:MULTISPECIES: UDP-N-acetylglucosamine 2-epimerase [Clostridium]KAI3350331.1 UDP-N-acetylglucosamine 2-epimerase [Clostridium botulinum]KOM88174.1 UDP-N-acetylglucosamine 2-epimerase [Clostridium botulinum]KOR55452.1 UDP-N-acetylglucosamine 2-epimerase [Clostridium botulinum]MBN1034637.1 UDP-N-acetylglucosamine 2-epimerase (hydrolyzing) [Clostridium botulinum]MBY7023862.1 UDP-N-acetylglucosamine 2-epimerase (hydrolyzing) [Clostridium botulinum]
MKKILVVTGTRAEYGLLYWTMKKIKNDSDLKLQLIVTGNHLIEEFGYTVNQIKEDGFQIDEEIDMIIKSKKKSSILKSMGIEMIQMAQCFDRLKPDLLLILGDRYETFIAAICAMILNIPIAHMNGGESTEGAIDEQIRHAITKIAHIHFTGAEYYKERILKMGEEAWRVYNVGQAGIENIKKLKLFNKEELQKELNINFDKPTFLITYHPVTLELETTKDQIENLLNAIRRFDANYIFTFPNSDSGNEIIIKKINDFVKKNKNSYIYSSLGQKRYLSLLKYVDIMIGNSSSGIIEAPSFNLPVLNIGSRQNGRLKNNNIIDVGYNEEEIYKYIDKILYNSEFKEKLRVIKNVYGDGHVSDNIVNILKTISLDKKLIAKKLTY